MISNVDLDVMCLLAISMSSLEKMSILVLFSVLFIFYFLFFSILSFNWVVFDDELHEFFVHFGYLPLVRYIV